MSAFGSPSATPSAVPTMGDSLHALVNKRYPTVAERVAAGREIIARMCSGDHRWQMCVPPDGTDSDLVFITLLDDYEAIVASHAEHATKGSVTDKVCALGSHTASVCDCVPSVDAVVPSPWLPERDPVAIALLGKLCEELNEAGSAAARCLHPVPANKSPTTIRAQW